MVRCECSFARDHGLNPRSCTFFDNISLVRGEPWERGSTHDETPALY